MRQRARTCETAAADATQEVSAGASSLREKNEADAKVWQMKAQVWIEAEAVRSAATANEV